MSSKRSSSSIFNDCSRSDRGNQSLNNIISGFSLTLLGTLCLSRRRWVFDHKWWLHTIDNAISAQRLNSNSSPSRPAEKKVCIVSHLSYLRWLCALCDYSRFGCVDSPFYGNLRNCRNKLSAAEKMCFWWRVASKRFTRLSLVVMSKRHLLHCMPFYKTEINVTCHFHWQTFKLGERGVKLLFCINIFNIFSQNVSGFWTMRPTFPYFLFSASASCTIFVCQFVCFQLIRTANLCNWCFSRPRKV